LKIHLIRRVGKDNIDFGKMRYHFSAMSVVNLDAARGVIGFQYASLQTK